MELNITLSKLEYTPSQLKEISEKAILKGFNLCDDSEKYLLVLTHFNLSKISQMIRIIKAIEKIKGVPDKYQKYFK